MHQVIIGNSAAGLAGAETIRRLDAKARITIISDEPYPAYCRPLLTFLLAGEVSEAALWLKGPDYYERWGFEALLGRRVVAVYPQDRTVILADGHSLTYDQLLIASGAQPILPDLPGRELAGVFTIRTLAKLQELLHLLQPGCRVAVLGAGLVGLKTAQALAQRGLAVTLVEKEAQALPGILDPTAADLLHQTLRELGIGLRLKVLPVALSGNRGRVAGVVLAAGEEIPAEVVVISVGVRPKVDFLAGTVLAEPRGIAVNRRQETALPGVYAAGDCARPVARLTGEPVYYAIWPAAVAQGLVAGANMAGQARDYDGLLPQNSLYVGRTRIIAGGLLHPSSEDGEVYTEFDPAGKSYRRLVIQEDRLVGLILVNRVEDAGVYFSLMAQRTPLRSLPVDPRRSDFQVGRLLA